MEDFHIHTIYSDGSDNVEQISKKAEDLSMFSVTDHNSIEACKKINMPTFVNGIEFSIFAYNRELHLLGYDYDIHNKLLKKIVSEYQFYNNEIFIQIFKKVIEKYRLMIDFQEVQSLIDANITLNKVNLAKILVQNGVERNLYDAYYNYIREFCDINYFYISIQNALEAIKHDNGFLFWAHPFVHNLSDNTIEEIILKAKNIGIDGIEVTNEHFDKAMYLVQKNNLCYSVGSDYHGVSFKKCNRIGVNTTMFQNDKNYIKNMIRR